MFNDEGEKICGRYTVIYKGYLFFGDHNDRNFHDMDDWGEVHSLMDAYPDIITVKDNEYGVTWANGEWY